MAFRAKNLLLLGAPGSGKGTYGKLLAKALHVPLITVGDIIRNERSEELLRIIRSGKLVPDDVVVQMVKNRLGQTDAKDGFILDGFPRNTAQALALETDIKVDISLALQLQLKKEEYLIRKLLGRRICTSPGCTKSFNVAHVENQEEGVYMPALLPNHKDPERCECNAPLSKREDDTEATIRERLKVYETETMPLLNFYKQRGVLVEFTILRGLDDMPKIKECVKKHLNHA